MGIGDEVRARRHGVRLSAQRRFTNRAREIGLFERKLADVREVRRQADWAEDLSSPRRNVVVFHGYGGIGKTRLSLELQRSFLGVDRAGSASRTRATGATAAPDVARPADARQRAAVRVDFSEPSARDAELYVFALRAGLARLSDRFPAFDTALALWWARQHPGASMAEFVRHQSVLGGLTDRTTLATHLRQLVTGLVDSAGPLVGGARRLFGLTWDKVQEVASVRHLRRACSFFEPCLTEEDLDELRLHLPLLLAWDLAQMRDGDDDVELVVFLDTFEHVSHARRTPRFGDLEDAIARSAFFLHGVTFVVTTRSPLDWHEDRRQPTLAYAGTRDWPGLAVLALEGGSMDPPSRARTRVTATTPAADQHEIGVLDSDDCEQWLASCLTDEATGGPALSADLRRGIAQLSGGVPLYLDVAVNHYVNLVSHGREPSMSDFSAGIPEIVLRLMEDLDADETDLLRVAALLGVFDGATLRAALPNLRSSTVDGFLARSFVLDRGDGLHSIHELLQISVRARDEATSNRWSADEWRAAERRLVEHWSTQFRSDTATLWRDRRTQALAFWQLATLYATTDVDADVLADVVMLVQLHGVWATLDAARNQPDDLLVDRGRALLRVLDGVLARQIGNLAQCDAALSEALAMPALTGSVRRLAQYYLAETQDIHEGDATVLFGELAEVDDRIGTEARLAHAHSLTRTGDLAGALAIAEGFDPDDPDPEFRYRIHELLGVVWLFAGRFGLAAEHFAASRHVGEAEGSPLLMALGARHMCLALCWVKPDEALALLDEAETMNRDLNLPPGIGQCLMARAVCALAAEPAVGPPRADDDGSGLDALAGANPARSDPNALAGVENLLADAEATFLRAGYVDDALGPVALGVLAAVATGNDALASQRRMALTERAKGRRPRTWLAAVEVWTGERAGFDQVSWPQGADAAYADWRSVLTRLRDS